jgi:flavin-dependent dehydrogenase
VDAIDTNDWAEWEYVIAGGGVAGLSAANRLVDLGHKPLVIEAGSHPSHKVCGEFFSPEALPILEEWKVPLASEIDKIHLHARGYQHTLTLQHPAGAASRYNFDHALANRARQKGATIMTETRITAIHPGKPHRLILSSGGKITANHLILGTGISPEDAPRSRHPYIGFKAHFRGIPMQEELNFFSLPGAYLGIAPLGEDLVNVACLLSATQFKESPDLTIERLLREPGAESLRERLRGGEQLFPTWMTASLPAFGKRPTPHWPNAYFIGNAAASIAPASGDGLAMAITSGWLAAEYASVGDAAGFRWAWRQEYRLRLRWANRLHFLMTRPRLARIGFKMSTFFPPLGEGFFTKTRS